jgi:hypothetical protein
MLHFVKHFIISDHVFNDIEMPIHYLISLLESLIMIFILIPKI